MIYTLDNFNSYLGLTAAIGTTIKSFLEDVNVRLVPMRAQFKEIAAGHKKTKRLLKEFAVNIYQGDPYEEVSVFVSTDLAISGDDGHSVGISTDFFIHLKLSEENQLEVDVLSPINQPIHHGDIPTAYAWQIMKELLSNNTPSSA